MGLRLLVTTSGSGEQLLAFFTDGDQRGNALDQFLRRHQPLSDGHVTGWNPGKAVTSNRCSPKSRLPLRSPNHTATACSNAEHHWPTTATGQEMQGSHSGVCIVFDAAFSRDGQFVATACVDGPARIWPIAGGDPVECVGHQGEVRACTFSPEGDRLATASSDATARIWDLTGRELLVLRGHRGPLWAVS
ncbi:MAG: WD40 repeat protein [Planctomycetota bacterium]